MMMGLSKCFAVMLVALCLANMCSSQYSMHIEKCCNIVSQSSFCHDACMQFASQCPPQVDNKTHYLIDFCPQLPPSLGECFNNITINSTTSQPTPSPQLIDCCSKSSNSQCVQTCTEQVTAGVLDDASIQAVIASCGPPIADPIWPCLLLYSSDQGQSTPASNEESTAECPTTPSPPPLYADWPRLHCCSKANDSACGQACYHEYTGRRTNDYWNKLNTDCIFRATEGSLTSCLDDVTTRCIPGCSGLSFCSNFNNRLTSFRTCTPSDDLAAKSDYTQWSSSNMILNPLVNIHIKPISECLPDHWRAVACIFNLQPCQPQSHTSLICKKDCVDLMTECKSNTTTQSPDEICELLSPSHLQNDCISLNDYLYPSNDEFIGLSTPCSSNPCTNGECVVNHDCTNSSCQSYYCTSECQLGNSPNMIVPKTSVIHVSTSSGDDGGSSDCHGYVNVTTNSNGMCTFGQKYSNISGEYCRQIANCTYKANIYSHGEVFNDDCNVCSCQWGSAICTHHVCPRKDSSSSSSGSCNPPMCDCHAHYNPVCTVDGITFPNIWFANCHGYQSDQFIPQSSCSSRGDPCDSAPCSSGSKCVPHPHTCITENGTVDSNCPQHMCVDNQNCANYRNKFICDMNGRQYLSLCDFSRTHERIDYFGYCQVECSNIMRRRTVCGVNGRAYPTSCHAHGAGVAVDYVGGCLDVPNASGVCEVVDHNCPALPYFNSTYRCNGVKPPGSCCHQCGSVINLLIDQDHLSHNRKALDVSSIESTRIIEQLRSLIDIFQCKVYGHQSIDKSSFILVVLPSNATSYVNVEACNAEATKLSSLINRDSPIISTNPYLSFFKAADPTHAGAISITVTGPGTGSLITPDSSCINFASIMLVLLMVLSAIFAIEG